VKLTKSQLKQIIKEEIARSLTEDNYEEESIPVPDAVIFRRLAADLRALEPRRHCSEGLNDIIDELLMQQEDFKVAWEDAQQAEVDEEGHIEL